MEVVTEEAMEKATEEVMEKAMEESVTRGLWDLMVDMDINRATHPAMANQVTVTVSPAMGIVNRLMDTANRPMATVSPAMDTVSPATVTASPAMVTANPLTDTAATVNLVMDINASIKSNRIASVIFYILS